jgi:hypothetical protein
MRKYNPQFVRANTLTLFKQNKAGGEGFSLNEITLLKEIIEDYMKEAPSNLDIPLNILALFQNYETEKQRDSLEFKIRPGELLQFENTLCTSP